MSRREAGRRARLALAKAREASPMTTMKDGVRTHVLQRSGQERNLWVGYHLAYKEMATGKTALVDGLA